MCVRSARAVCAFAYGCLGDPVRLRVSHGAVSGRFARVFRVYAWRLWLWVRGSFGWFGRRSRCAWVAFGVLTSVSPPPLLVLALRFSLGRRPCLSCLFRSASRRCVVCVAAAASAFGSRSLVSLCSCSGYAARPGSDVGMGLALCVVCDACVCARLARLVRGLRVGV